MVLMRRCIMDFCQSLTIESNDNKELLFQSNEAFMLGNLFKNLYQSYKGFSNYCVQANNPRLKLLIKLQTYEFVAHELNLYLDNHPNNIQMLTLFYDYCKKVNELTKEYENNYGSLNVDYENNSYHFLWIEEPWPWQYQ